jgi:Fe2+ or Zn2+ uptake regulation protein
MINYMQTQKCPTLEEFKQLLKKHSLKATPQRLAVHEAMIVLGHASADMVTEEILAQGKAKVTVASVYNILTQLAMLGVYHHRLSSNNKMYFDVNTFYHAHFYDKENHTFKDVLDDELASAIHTLLGRKRFKGYKVESIDIQIVGRPNRKKYMV